MASGPSGLREAANCFEGVKLWDFSCAYLTESRPLRNCAAQMRSEQKSSSLLPFDPCKKVMYKQESRAFELSNVGIGIVDHVNARFGWLRLIWKEIN